MSISLYDSSIKTYLQLLKATQQFLAKGESFCNDNNIDTSELLKARIHEDMLPLFFQIVSISHHSLGAIKGIEKGEFNPPVTLKDAGYAEHIALIDNAITELESYSPESIEGLMGKPMKFKMGSIEIPFQAENFVLSFSLPNFFFHVTTAYDILRMKGVKLGKMDYLGQMRIG